MEVKDSESSIFAQVKQIVVEQLDVDSNKVTLDANFSELGADSLDTVELVMAIEEKFEIEIPDKDAEEISNLQQAVDFIQSSVKTKIK